MRIGLRFTLAAAVLVWAKADLSRAVVYDDGIEPGAYALPGVLIVKYAMPLEISGAQAASSDRGAHIGVESIDRIHDRHRVQRVDRLFPKVLNPRFAARPRSFERFVRIRFPEDTDIDALKRELAAAFPNDSRKYTEAKGPFIRAVLRSPPLCAESVSMLSVPSLTLKAP